jgi:hypothetical protein
MVVIIGDMAVILAIHASMQRVIPAIKEVEVSIVVQDLEMLEQERRIMDEQELHGEMLVFRGQLEGWAFKMETLEQRELHVMVPGVYQQAVKEVYGIARTSSSRVIGIKALQQSIETIEPAARTAADILEVRVQVMDSQDQAGEVRHQVIRRSHRAGQVLPQLHRHQEAVAVADAKAVVQADQAVNYNRIINGVM